MSHWLKIISFFRKFFTLITKIFSSVLGGFSWIPPVWLKNICYAIKNKFNQNRKKFVLTSLASLSVLAGMGFGINWYLNLPEPDYVKMTLTKPGPMYIDVESPTPDDLSIRFDRSVREISKLEIDEKDIQISPKIEGTWKWSSDSYLYFSPKTDWKIATQYFIKFSPSLFSKNLKFKTLQADFETKNIEPTSMYFEFYINPENRKEKKLTAEIKFSHLVDFESAKKNIFIQDEAGKELDLEWKLNPKGHIVYITSENIKIKNKEVEYKLIVNEGIKAKNQDVETDEKGEKKYIVPSIYNYFKVNNLAINVVNNEKLEAEQVLAIEFSDDISEAEMKKNMRVVLLPKKDRGLWSEANNELINRGEKLKLTLIPNERDASTTYFYKIKHDPGRQIFVEFKKGFKSLSGFELPIDFSQIISVPQFPTLAQIQQKGGLLSMMGDKKLSITSRGVREIEVRVNRLKEKEINHLLTQSYGDFTDPNFNYNFGFQNISEAFTETIKLNEKKLDELQYSSVDLDAFINKGSREGKGVYYIELVVDDEVKDKRFLVVSDLSLVYKRSNQGDGLVFIHSLKNGAPVANVKVDVIGTNGLSIFTDNTNAEGKADIISLSTFIKEKYPQYIVAKIGEDLSFLPLNREDRNLNFSRFDVGGFEESSPSALNAFIFSQRGLFRPGEEVHLGYIVRSGDWKTKLTNIPIEIEVLNSKGSRFLVKKEALTEDGFGEINFDTSIDSPTGIYTVLLKQVGIDENKNETLTLIGQSTFKVEDFEPDTLSISSSLSEAGKIGWNPLQGNEIVVTLRNLFGTPAIGHKISGQIILTNSFPEIREYKDYKFYNPNQEYKSMTEDLGDKETNDKGEVNFKIDLEKIQDGLFQLVFKGEGFAKNSGRSVMTAYSMMVSNRPYIIGYRTDQTDLEYIKEKTSATMEIVALDQTLTPKVEAKLKLKLIEHKSISTLMKGDNGLYKYQVVEKKIELSEKEIKFNKGKYKLDIPTDKVGKFEFLIEDDKKVTFLKIPFSIAGPSDDLQKLSRTSELDLKLNKESYENGEEIELQITAPYAGSGLITIERDRVYHYEWFKASQSTTIQKIRLPAGIEGNAYINVIYARDIKSKEIFASPLSYAVKPFNIDREKRVGKIELKYPEMVKPGDEIKIEYSTKTKQKIILFGVDQGILQVARYKVPDPLSFFFKKKMHQVSTLQLIDLIMPEYSVIKEIFADGGDIGSLLSQNLNPFKRKANKAVVFWSGILDSGPVPSSFSYVVPDYFNGSIKIFAVAVDDGKIGVIEEKTTVKGDFVIDPQLPIFAVPGDHFELAVLVTNNLKEKPSEKVTIEVKDNNQFKVVGVKTHTVDIKTERDYSLSYQVETLSKLGAGEIEITANANDKKAKIRAAIGVRAGTQYQVKLQSQELSKNGAFLLDRKIYEELGAKKIRASHSPLVLALGLQDYLDIYPYGCVEQLVSKGFPTLYLSDYTDKKINEQKWQKLIQNLRISQNADGMMGIFPNYELSYFNTVYATHFLIEAKQQNKKVDLDFLNSLKDGLSKTFINKVPTDIEMARNMAYALYVLSLDGYLNNNALVTLRQNLDKNFKDWKSDLVAVFVAGTYSRYKIRDYAQSIFKSIKMDKINFTKSYILSDEVVRAYYLIVLAQDFPELKEEIGFDEILKLIQKVSQKGYTSLSTALTIMTLAKWPGDISQTEITDVLTMDGNRPLTLEGDLIKKVDAGFNATKIKIESQTKKPVYYQSSEIGFETKDLPLLKNGAEVFSKILDIKGKEVKSAIIGQTYTMEINARAIDQDKYYLAIVQMLPAGFELVLKRGNTENELEQSQESRVEHNDEGEGDGEAEQYNEGENSSDQVSASSFDNRLEGQESSFNLQYLDLREDRVILYVFSLEPKITYFKFNVKAIYKGTFTNPGAYIEGMYRPEVQAQALASKIEIKEN